MVFLSNLAQVSLPSTVVLYATHRYGWSSTALGLTLALVGVALIIVQVGVVGRFVRAFGSRAALVCGLIFGTAGLTIVALAPTGLQLWMAIPVLALWGLAGPSGAGDHDPARQRFGAGPAAGRQRQPGRDRRAGRGPSSSPLPSPTSSRRDSRCERSGAPFLLAAVILAAAAAWAFMATRREDDQALS